MKKTIITIMLVLAMVLTGCSGGSKEPTAKNRPTTGNQANNAITLAINTVTTTLDPQNFALNVESAVLNNIYEQLFFLDNDGNPVYMLAESFDVAEDGSYVIFHLRQGVKFQSGDIFSAEDVKYTFDRNALSAVSGVLNQYATCEVIDENTVQFSFPYAALGADFSAVYTYFEMMKIVNKSYCEQIIENPGDNLYYNTDGTGAYQLSEVAVNGDITLTRYADYWGEASIDTIYYRLNTGDTELAFESGDLDVAGVSVANSKAFATYENVAVEALAANYVAFTIQNIATGSKLNDMKLRQAVVYAMNKDDIAAIASGGAGTTAYNLANPLVTYYTDDVNHYDRDLEKSKSLLTEAGYSESNKLELTLITMAADSDWVNAAQVIKENLEESYFTVTIVECSDTTKYFTGDFDLGFIGVGLTTSFTSFSMLFDSLNLCCMDGDELAAMQADFATIADEATTQKVMRDVVDSLAYIPAYYTISYLAHDTNLQMGTWYNEVTGYFIKDCSWK